MSVSSILSSVSLGVMVLLPFDGLLAQETLNVDATGVGATAEAAEKAALINAVQQAVGLFLDNESLVKNEQVVYDSILSLSDGFVSRFEVKSPPKARVSDGLFETKISALVQKGRIGAELEKRQLTQKVDAEASWAEAVTSVKSAQDAVAVFEKWMPILVAGSFTARSLDDRGGTNVNVQPETRPDPATGQAICGWNFVVSYNRPFFFEKVAPLLTKVFNAISEQTLPEFSVSAPSTYSVMGKPGSRRLALTGALLRFPDSRAIDFPKIQRDEMIVCLNTSADKSRQNLRFQAWVVNKAIYGDMIKSALPSYRMVVRFSDEKGQVVSEGGVPLETTLLEPGPKDRRASRMGLMGPETLPLRTEDSPLSYWIRGSGPQVLWMSPDFRVGQIYYAGSGGMADDVIVHVEKAFDPDDIRRLKNVSYFFVPLKSNR